MDNTLPTFSVFETIKTAWQQVQGTKRAYWSVWLLMVLADVFFGSIHFATLLAAPLFNAYTITTVILILINTVNYIIFYILSWGLLYIGVQRAFNQPVRFATIKHVFDIKLFFKMLGVFILEFLILLPALCLIVWPTVYEQFIANPVILTHHLFSLSVAVSYIVGLVLFVYLTTRFHLGVIITIVEKCNPWTAIQLSFKATKSKVWKLLGLFLLNSLMIAAGLILFVTALLVLPHVTHELASTKLALLIVSALPMIGFIWLLPYVVINMGVVYKRLVVDKLV